MYDIQSVQSIQSPDVLPMSFRLNASVAWVDWRFQLSLGRSMLWNNHRRGSASNSKCAGRRLRHCRLTVRKALFVGGASRSGKKKQWNWPAEYCVNVQRKYAYESTSLRSFVAWCFNAHVFLSPGSLGKCSTPIKLGDPSAQHDAIGFINNNIGPIRKDSRPKTPR